MTALSIAYDAEAEAKQLHGLLSVLERIKSHSAGPFIDDLLSDLIHDTKVVIETEAQERDQHVSETYADFLHDDRANGWAGIGL